MCDHLTNLKSKCISITMLLVYYAVSSTGSVTYSEVKTFLEKDPTVVKQYQAITTLCNESLILSGNHNVFARKYSSEEFKIH